MLFMKKNATSTVIYTHSYGSCKYESSQLIEFCY